MVTNYDTVNLNIYSVNYCVVAHIVHINFAFILVPVFQQIIMLAIITLNMQSHPVDIRDSIGIIKYFCDCLLFSSL